VAVSPNAGSDAGYVYVTNSGFGSGLGNDSVSVIEP
jgi:DNA-binding beta-propeller fold protein YncE